MHQEDHLLHERSGDFCHGAGRDHRHRHLPGAPDAGRPLQQHAHAAGAVVRPGLPQAAPRPRGPRAARRLLQDPPPEVHGAPRGGDAARDAAGPPGERLLAGLRQRHQRPARLPREDARPARRDGGALRGVSTGGLGGVGPRGFQGRPHAPRPPLGRAALPPAAREDPGARLPAGGAGAVPQHLCRDVRAEPHADHAGHPQAGCMAECPDGAGREDRDPQRPLRVGLHHAGVAVRRHEAARPLQAPGHLLRADVFLALRAQASLRVPDPGGTVAEQLSLQRVV
mmetsp:Transcript_35924/g.111598  ORF Transcript_35924/g.111598 Transcript_35924/m.111598 type:complete len:283 (+) Transcript_35924:482-1330(+)